jgi:hypothetical protein
MHRAYPGEPRGAYAARPLRYPLGPPLIGALLRMPLDAVVARILAGLHEAGFTDLVPAHFPVLRYPGPENRRPSELAAEARMTKQAMNYLLGQMQQLGYLTATTTRTTSASSASASPSEDTPPRERSATSSPRSRSNWNRSSDRHSSTNCANC